MKGWPGSAQTAGATVVARPQRFPVSSLRELLGLPEPELEKLDIALVNLLCAEGLPGSEGLNIPQCLSTLDRWTDGVRRYTRDHRNQFYVNLQEYNGHKGLFCFLFMASFLKHPNGIGVKYNPTAIGNFDFRDSRDDLLHGLLTRKLGTCTSLPTLCVAIGRRLGYPMHLAVAKGHVLCQWVDERSRINLEISCPQGGDTASDEHYQNAQKLTAADIASGRYLRPLSRAEELALFMETRGHCLMDNRRFAEARQAYEQAHRAAPNWSEVEKHLYSLSLAESGRYRLTYRGQSVTEHVPWSWDLTINAPIASGNLFPTIVSLPGFTVREP